ncbi:MAG: riboflavin biosynthesis protein RibF [Clostridia bacterium]|nr:riboflavin biosynthesis protein RibF [Clostridia bacterium]
MKICSISRVDDLPRDGAVFVALGNFDGVHLGHAALLDAAKEGAASLSTPDRIVRPAVFTFRQGKASAITTLEERIALFAQHGIEVLFIADFDAFCRQSPEIFVRRTLKGLGAVGLTCGFNFRFGHRAAGDVRLLKTFAAAERMNCRVIPPIIRDGITVSSTEIRHRLSKGDLAGVSYFLGRPWSIMGEVVHGRAVGGRILSSPTLNLPVSTDRLLPPFGVYFTEAVIDGIRYPSVTNLGVRPTFGESEVLCETHLLDASGDFYGKTAEIRFLNFRRPERRFTSAEELADVIADDIADARRYFSCPNHLHAGT